MVGSFGGLREGTIPVPSPWLVDSHLHIVFLLFLSISAYKFSLVIELPIRILVRHWMRAHPNHLI